MQQFADRPHHDCLKFSISYCAVDIDPVPYARAEQKLEAMADSVDRVFGHALNTVNKIRPGSQKPPASDRLTLYGLYKQSMEGDVNKVADRPTASNQPSLSPDNLRREQDKWDAWKANETISKTEAKRRYIEKLIDTMQKYASQSDESRQLVEELEFVWEQVRSNSQPSGSDHSSPLHNLERSAYIHSDGQEHSQGLANSAAALGNIIGTQDMRVMSPVSAPEEEPLDEDRDEFVDAPISQVGEDYHNGSDAVIGGDDDREFRRVPARRGGASTPAYTWRKRVEASLMKLTTEIAALREQLESKRYIKNRQQNSVFGWILRLSWWAVQLIVADAVLLWIVIWYLRQRRDRRLEGAIRVLLGDAVAEVRRVRSALPRMTIRSRSHG